MSDESRPEASPPAARGEALVSEFLPEFETSLGARAKVPAPRISDYLTVGGAEIRRESEQVAEVLKRFAQAVVDSMESPRCADDFLRELDLKTVSRDHDWRKIFRDLRARDPSYDEHKRVLIIKYLQYLSFRKRLLEFIYQRRRGLEETADYDLPREPGAPRSSGGAAEGEPARSGDAPAAERERLPLGETVEVALPENGVLEVRLAGRAFRLEGPSRPCLVDPNGVSHYLRKGRNMVGRHPESDVVIDQDFADVSRAHAIMDWVREGVVRITDLSTRGTFVDADAIRPHP